MSPPDSLASVETALQALVSEYQALNSSTVAILDHTPTALEFSKYVAANRPVVLRGQGKRERVAAIDTWSNEYLIERMGRVKCAVAVSPHGNADSIVDDRYFVEPAEVRMEMAELLDRLKGPGESPASVEPVYYLQSQNGNLSESGDLSPLASDVGDGPSFAREMFGEPPEVANVWIGDGRSVTSMHKDPYENIYLVVRGSKTFTLLPPTEFSCLHERRFELARYSFTPPSSFDIVPTLPAISIPWIPVDPINPDLSRFPRFKFAQPLTVTLEKGDMLYLPGLWFHRVSQESGLGPNGAPLPAAIAVNWWYDMRMEGHLWSLTAFVRKLSLLLDGIVEEEDSD